MWPDSMRKGPWRNHGHGRNQRSVDIPTAPASSRASRASGLDTPGLCGSPFSECLGKDLHWEGQSVYCPGCKPSLCLPLPSLTTRIPFAYYLTAGRFQDLSPPPAPSLNQVCAGGDSFLHSPFPSCHFLGARGRQSPSQTYLTHQFFPKPDYDGHRPRPGPAKMLPCEYLHRALLWEPGIIRAWHLSPACLVTLGRSKPHCKKSCSLCLSA